MRAARFAIVAAMVAIASPAMALPGPLRLAEAELPKPIIPTQRTAAEYASHIALGGMFELASAKLALQKSKSAATRAYANRIITAHAAGDKMLRTAVSQSPARITLPASLDNAHMAMLDQLRRSSGAEFDTRYIQSQVDEKELALELHTGFSQRGEDSALKRYASVAQTRVERDLTEVRKISHSLGGLQPRA